MLVELMRHGGAELCRRWVAALLMAPEEERLAIVEQVEARMASVYGEGEGAGAAAAQHDINQQSALDLVEAPVQRDGYVEQTIHTYQRVHEEPALPMPEHAQPGQLEAERTEPVQGDKPLKARPIRRNKPA